MGGFDVLEGIRVVEVAIYGFVPSGAAVLADWGAEVLKVEHPRHGDPLRGITTKGLAPGGTADVNFLWQSMNRGKRSVGIDLTTETGRAIVLDLARDADVFLTNFLPDARRKLGLDVDDVRAVNPTIVYARGSGHGPLGEDAARGGYDGATFWARAGIGAAATPIGAAQPAALPSAAFGDVLSGAILAGGIAAALVKRARTGAGSVVDVSLLGAGMWALQPSIVLAGLTGLDRMPEPDDESWTNPMVHDYRTADGRFVMLCMLEGQRHWPDLCARLGRTDLVDDSRFVDDAARARHSKACIDELARIFASQPLAHWSAALSDATGVWAPYATPKEVLDDPQAIANGYLRPAGGEGAGFTLVASPVQFDERQLDLEPAPEVGQHTEMVLLERGFDWDAIAKAKGEGAIT